jgi:predicted regulator of Ras-like GTPase activity (Roadblock/LC7/MglB family)
MFESFKKLFSRQASPLPDAPPPQLISISAAPPQPFPSRPASTPRPPSIPALPSGPAPVALRTGDVVHLPLNDILALLPSPVAPLLLARPGGTFSLPVRSAVEQLATGTVRVRFAQLRQTAPPGTFAHDASQDETLIDLPLAQILSAIGPAAFSRRAQQKATPVPDDVTGVFGPKGKRLSAMPSTPRSAPSPAPVAPAVSSVPVVPKPATPAPPPSPAPSIKPAPAETILKPPAPAPLPYSAPKAPSPLPFATRPTPAAAPAPPAPMFGLPKPAAAAIDDGPLVTTIGAVCQSWPYAVRQEVEQFNLREASISIPMNSLETGMKGGRVVFAWGELIGWLDAPPSTQSSQGDAELELPLNVIAPLYFGKRRAAVPRKKLSVDQNIPDLFAGLGKPAVPPPTPAPVAATPVAVPPVAPVPVIPVPVTPVAVVPKPVVPAPVAIALAATPVAPVEKDSLGQIFGRPSKTDWSPQEIAQEISALPGVAGSLLATADGLLVAGEVPPPLEPETLAAFLPHILGRVSSCSEEIKLGAMRGVTLSTDSGPCAIFKAGALHLAVVGTPGQSLPESILVRIAAHLGKPH